MKRTYLVVFEKGVDSWSGFAPDVAGTGGLGDSFEEARESLRAGIGYMLEDALERGLSVPEAISTSVDFSEFDPNPAQSQYVIEWLTIDVPEGATSRNETAQQAA